jgi:hypothetical protein
MTLAAWQASLAKLVIAHAARPEAFVPLPEQALVSNSERRWLRALEPTPGFKMTCAVQRWWREFRVQTAAPLTLAVLDADRRSAIVAEYVRRYNRPSSFFLREALPFLDLAVELASDVPHVHSLAGFERAMLLVGEAVASGAPDDGAGALHAWDLVAQHGLADVVRFEAPPAQLLAAASGGTMLPPVTGQTYWILVAPHLPNLARACSDVEAGLFHSLRDAPAHVAQIRRDPQLAEALGKLWQAGALRTRG